MTGKAIYNEFTEGEKITHTEEIDFWLCFGDETFNGFNVTFPKKIDKKKEHEILIPTNELLKELLEHEAKR